MAAKILFLLALIYVPLFVAQMVLLAVAGFSPFHYLPGLLHLHLLLLIPALFLVLLAVVTTGAGQTTRAILIALLYLGAVWALDSMLPNAAWRGSSGWDWVGRCLVIGVPLIVIVRQYALRRTTNARQLLLAGALAVLVLTAATPYRRLIEREYPRPLPGEEPVFHLRLNAFAPGSLTFYDKQVMVVLPLSTGQFASGYAARIEAILVTLDFSDGTHWDSGWEPREETLSKEMFTETNAEQAWWQNLNPAVNLDRQMFQRVKDLPAKVRVTLATTLFREKASTLISRTRGEFEVPGVGICAVQGLLWCRSPLHRPAMVGVSGRLLPSCPPSEADLANSSVPVTGWISDFETGPIELGLSPISTFTFYTSRHTADRSLWRLCPGSPLTFTQTELVGHVRIEAEFGDVKLGDAMERR